MKALRTFGAVLPLLLAAVSQMAFDVPGNTEHLKAPWDPACNYMKTTPAPLVPPALRAELKDYFEAPIPKTVHQIWFGDPAVLDRRGPHKWQEYAEQFGYSYKLWSEADEDQLQSLMPPQNFALWRQYVRLGDYYGASDLVRLSLLEQHGGVYVDVDMWPPSWEGAWVDLAELMPMRNIVLMTEKTGRNVIESSLFVANGFMMAAQGHPLMRHLVATVEQNVTALNEGPLDDHSTHIPMHTMYMTGPFFVSRSLAGTFTILPFNYGVALKMREYEPGAN